MLIKWPCLIIFASILFTHCSKGSNGGTKEPPAESGTENTPPTILTWPDAGQAICYNTTTTTACTGAAGGFPRQDGDFANVPAARSYTGPTQHGTYTSDYTTLDNTTGLRWRTCSEGLSGTTCATGAVSVIDWQSASNQCTALNSSNSGAGYAGIKSWRLPTSAELETLVDYGVGASPAINAAAFPATASGPYWTTSVYKGDTTRAWFINLTEGNSGDFSKTSTARVRCVATVTQPTNTGFTDLSDGTIRDNKTNLVWQKCTRGLSGTDCSGGSTITDTWANSLTYCNGLSLASRSWRLPSISELQSIVDHNLKNPAISGTYFPNTPSTNAFASSTSYSISSAMNAWSLIPGDGSTFGSAKVNATHFIRCVATGP